mmetsp:Transcript_21664/g.73651  ORF Transcript_21664/g.73651 Transcript_21664/m.73651 type:complete len:236 (+) Transcript_21664:151-858(+)
MSADATAAASGFFGGFAKSTAMILMSEIGDKTFFIAAIMAMRHSRVTVLAGALGALWVMTVLSAALGWVAPTLIPKAYTHYAATALFFFFGVRTLWDVAREWNEEGGSELAEVEAELNGDLTKSPTHKKSRGPKVLSRLGLATLLTPVFVETFVLTFLAEWGDRSQIATIMLAAQSDVYGVTLGGILGHSVCTGGAVVGGRQLSTQISEKTVALCGGVLFICFGLHAALAGPPQD